jgi:protein-tyrosine phosphatase
LPHLEVGSAGTAALDGRAADPLAVELMRERGIDLGDHVARTVTPDALRAHDLVLVAAQSQHRWLSAHYPYVRGRIYRLLHCEQADIEDPYRRGRDIFAASLAQIERGIAYWTARLRSMK